MPGPPKSHLDSDYKPICILIPGDGWIGKTTLCAQLQSDKVATISLDQMTQSVYDLNDPELMPLFERTQPLYLNIGILSTIFEESCPKYYAQKVFECSMKIAKDHPVIIMEGFTLTMCNIRESLEELLKKNNYIIWSLARK